MGEALVSHLLESDFVEARIYVACGIGLSFAVRYDEPYFCNALVLTFLSAYADIREGDEPSAGHAGASVSKIHGAAPIDFRIEIGCKAAGLIGNLHDVGIIMP